MACAASLANLEVFENENLVAESARKEDIFLDQIQGWSERFPKKIGRIHGKGCLFGVFITRDGAPENPESLDNQFCDRIVEDCMRRGVFIIRTGRGTLKFGPPLNIPDDALVEALSVIAESIFELV